MTDIEVIKMLIRIKDNINNEVVDAQKKVDALNIAIAEIAEKPSYNSIKTELEPCEDAISRQAAINVAIDAVDDWDGGCNLSREEYIRKALERLHPVKPAEKMGHWEWVQYDSNPNIGNWHCSECRTIIPHMPEETDNTPIYKWCPMCGSRMMQEVEE